MSVRQEPSAGGALPECGADSHRHSRCYLTYRAVSNMVQLDHGRATPGDPSLIGVTDLRMSTIRWASLRLGLALSLLAPLAALGAAPVFQRLAQSASRDGGFEDCVTACQLQVDGRIAQCPGYREIASPADRSPPPPKCKSTAIEQFESCKARCPAPRYSAQG